MQIKKWWSATMIKGKQCQLKPYLLDGVPQWASATVRIRRRDWLSQGKDWLERLEPSRHERLPLALFFDIVRKMALAGDRRQRRVQPLKISLRLQTQCVWGGLVPRTLLLVWWAIQSGALRQPFEIRAKDRARRVVSSVVGRSPLQLSCTLSRC
jgi:hypothetical protein